MSLQPRAIAAFSGGVDSTYTIWRHTMGGAERLTRKIEAGLLVHGFDIPLEQVQQFERCFNRRQKNVEQCGYRFDYDEDKSLRSGLGDDAWRGYSCMYESSQAPFLRGSNCQHLLLSFLEFALGQQSNYRSASVLW